MKKSFIIVTVLIFLISFPDAAFGHGVDIEYQASKVYKITASYDSGEPMSEAQVIIYAPDNPSEPWSIGKCDKNGNYFFTPDPSQQGTWDIQVRKAGHGGMIHITAEENAQTSDSTGFTTLQMLIMTACVIWGLIGTGLFFLGRRS